MAEPARLGNGELIRSILAGAVRKTTSSELGIAGKVYRYSKIISTYF